MSDLPNPTGPAFVLQGGDLVLPDGVAPATDLVIRDGRIARVGGEPTATGLPIIDAEGHTVLPGLIDLHVHGARGNLIGHGPTALENLSAALAEQGVTGFLPTLAGVALSSLVEETASLREGMEAPLSGAEPLGLNLEGPFLNPVQAGALPPGTLCPPDAGLARELIAASESRLEVLTLAPELEGCMALIELFAESGVVVAAGHTEAPFACMEEALAQGLSHITHCYNAMAGPHHRRPGPVEAALTLDGLTVEVIADGLHVFKPGLDILLRCKEMSQIALVSDATALSVPSGRLTLDFGHLEVEGPAVREPSSGGLVGSALPILSGIKMLRNECGLDLHRAVSHASAVPAKILGLFDTRGSLEPGKRADFCLLTGDGKVSQTYLKGRRVYPRP